MATSNPMPWTRTTPTRPGVYRIREWDRERPARVAVVVVRQGRTIGQGEDGARLEYNLGAMNTLHDCADSWSRVPVAGRLEWQGPYRLEPVR